MAQSLKNNKYVAIKCMKKKYESIEKVRRLKEIQALKLLMPHEYIINLIEVLYDEPSGKLIMIQENWPWSSSSWNRTFMSRWSKIST